MLFFGFRFCDLTGTDYSEGAIDLARNLSDRDGFGNINFLVQENFALQWNNGLIVFLSFRFILLV